MFLNHGVSVESVQPFLDCRGLLDTSLDCLHEFGLVRERVIAEADVGRENEEIGNRDLVTCEVVFAMSGDFLFDLVGELFEVSQVGG